MDEVGVDISKEFPKPLTDEVVRAADAVITMGCGDACPIYPGKRYEDWDLEDPAGKDLETVRRIRDEIRERVEALIGGPDRSGRTDGESAVAVGINGFGRMGRLALRAAWGWPELTFAHVNELHGDAATAAHLLKFDSIHGRWDRNVGGDDASLAIDGESIGYSGETEPGEGAVGRARESRSCSSARGSSGRPSRSPPTSSGASAR